MKKIFIAIFALAAVAACNKAEVIDQNPGEAIAFGEAFVDNATKATDPSYSNNDIAKFNVYGTVNNILIYPGTEITKGDAEYGAAWTCPVNQYWIPGAEYKFIGIVDGNKTDVTTTSPSEGMPTTISYKADGVTDLLCQTITKTANTDGSSNGLVSFTFKHLLSKVNFTVTNNSKDAANYSFKVKNIKFNGYTAATYDIASEKWKTTDPAPTVGDIAFGEITVASGTESAELITEKLLLPAEVTVSFTVDILYNDQVITSTDYPAEGTTYKYTLDAANAYNFNVVVSVGELIQFTVTKQPEWTTNTTTDLTL